MLKKHIAIMDELDPKNNVALLLDEWGTWWDVEPNTIPGHLFQQNTLRDAFVASLSLDIFHKYTRRLKMCNIAQVVNVLQSMILTDGPRMVLTPTYHVFRMYKVHQDATYLPVDIQCDTMQVRDNRTLPLVSATASKDKNGKIHLSISNIDTENARELTIRLNGAQAKGVTGEILTAAHINDYNSFDKPETVVPRPFKDARLRKGVLTLTMPAKSIVTLELQ